MKVGPESKKALKVSAAILAIFVGLFVWSLFEDNWRSPPPSEKEDILPGPPQELMEKEVFFDFPADNVFYVVDYPVKEEIEVFLYIPKTLGVDSDERLLL